LHSESAVNFRQYRIELEDVAHHADVFRADIAIDGSFEFRHLPAGEFLLRVTALNGDIIHQEFVPVNSHVGQLDVHLRTGRKPSAPGTISVTQLRHPPDRKAIQAFSAAQRLAPSSPEKAAEELEKAVRISPEFADAYTNLAVQHIRLRRFQEAVGELSRAIEIAGPDPLRLSNLAYAQINLSRVAESIGSVRAALRLDAGYPPAHLILGSILAADPRTRAEAIPHLEQAAESIPAARAMLEKVQAGR
jgi:tetratricopeptide (TPR) repeat protein